MGPSSGLQVALFSWHLLVVDTHTHRGQSACTSPLTRTLVPLPRALPQGLLTSKGCPFPTVSRLRGLRTTLTLHTLVSGALKCALVHSSAPVWTRPRNKQGVSLVEGSHTFIHSLIHAREGHLPTKPGAGAGVAGSCLSPCPFLQHSKAPHLSPVKPSKREAASLQLTLN